MLSLRKLGGLLSPRAISRRSPRPQTCLCLCCREGRKVLETIREQSQPHCGLHPGTSEVEGCPAARFRQERDWAFCDNS